MSYQPFLIANYATGFDRELQPWLLPNDAFTDLLDCYVYRGVTVKRDGYKGFATGPSGAYVESRMVHEKSAVAMTGAIDGVNKTFTKTLSFPIQKGSITISGSNPVQTLTDDGIGGFTGDGVGTIDYSTGAVSITLTSAPIALSTVEASYLYYPGLPVMGIMNFYTANNTRELIVADTKYVNKYNSATNSLVDISPATAYNGTKSDFWGWVNYSDSSDNPRLLFCNGVVGDVIQQYDGTNVTDYVPTFSVGTLNARQMFEFQDRLVLFQTIEAGTLYPRRIRISGYGTNTDVFDNTAPGAGFIDVPDNTWLFGATFNRDDIIFCTEAAVWMMKYTGNDVTPFTLKKLDGSRGCAAAFAVISYLNRTMAASPRGLLLVDGYQVERMDDNIPQFTFNDIQGQYFEQCFSAFLDEDRDVYMMYPSSAEDRPALVAADSSDRILVTNFEEDNFCIYRIPMSCMGNFQTSSTLTWNDLTAANGYANWNVLGAKFGNWNAFPFDKGEPISIGGGHKGEIWALNDTETEDNPLPIYAITKLSDQRIRVTTAWNNYKLGDTIVFYNVGGMVEINNRQGEIVLIDTDYNTFTVDFGQVTLSLSAYTSGGEAQKVIEFVAVTKKLNPFINMDKKIRVGWIYFYVNTTETTLYDANGNQVPAYLKVEIIRDDLQVTTAQPIEYLVDCSPQNGQASDKMWVKIWVNQVSKFLQFRLSNKQAGTRMQVHAMMPGIQPLGRLV